MMDPKRTNGHDLALSMTRRHFFRKSTAGIALGIPALASLLARDGFAAPDGFDPKTGGQLGFPNFAPKAKRVIFLHQSGAPSQIDLFDPKPTLTKMKGLDLPDSVRMGQRITGMTSGQSTLPVAPSIFNFSPAGKSGVMISDLLPHHHKIVDDITMIRTVYTDAINHDPAITFIQTGFQQPGRPSMGAWATYGLGTESQELPGFVVMTSRDKEASCGQIFYDFYWGSGFLPSKYQGVRFRGSGDPVLYLSNPDGMSREVRRGLLDDLAQLNEQHAAEFADPEITTRITQYEMAYKMQASVPELTDLSQESPETLEMYGPDVKRQGSFAYNCLMARRLIERGVRFVQCFHAGWDHHRNLTTQFQIQCRDTDQPSAALVRDLKQRGLLDDTLVIWGGEFGRTPFLQGDINDRKNWGRDHHPYAFTMWMAGGGTKPGLTYGESDAFGFNVVRDPVHVHDFQATALHLLGIDHERLTFRFQGRQFRLTDVHGKVVTGLLA